MSTQVFPQRGGATIQQTGINPKRFARGPRESHTGFHRASLISPAGHFPLHAPFLYSGVDARFILSPYLSLMLTLAIETSGPTGSVALVASGAVVAEKTLELGRQHAQALLPTIRSLLHDTDRSVRDLQLVAVSLGPGSYTGLRIGIVCAKTLAYAIGCPLAAVDTLQTIACNSPEDVPAVEVISDAQRGDLFVGRYARTSAGDWAPQNEIAIVRAEGWAAELVAGATISGPGLEKVANLLDGRFHLLPSECHVPAAVWVARLGIAAYEAGQAVDLWGIEPRYLRRSSAEVQWEKLHPGK